MNARMISFAALTAIAAVVAFFALREFQGGTETGFEESRVAGDEQAEGPRGPSRALDFEALRDGPRIDEEETAANEGEDAETGADLIGRLIDEEGRALAGVEVTLLRDDDEAFNSGNMRVLRRRGQADDRRRSRSDSEGRFRFRALMVGKHYRLDVMTARHIPLRENVAIDSTDLHDLGDLVMKEGASVSGRVLSKGRPVPGVLVSAEPATEEGRIVFRAFAPELEASLERPHSVRTDDAGRFEIAGLAAGDWDLLTDHADHQAAVERGIALDEREQKTGITIEIATGLKIHGRVLDEERKPLPGVRVQAVDRPMLGAGGSFVMTGRREARTDELGRFEIGGLLSREYSIHASCEGHMDGSVAARPGQDEIELQLPPSALVFGVIRDARTGATIENATLRPAASFGFFQSAQRAEVLRGEAAAAACGGDDARGLYAVPDLNRGGLRLEVDAPGYGRVRSRTLGVAPGERLRFDIELEPEARLDGRVLDPEGRPVAGAEVRFDRKSDGLMEISIDGGPGAARPTGEPDLRARNPEPVKTDAQGRYSVMGLAAGTFEVQARAEEFSPSVTESVTLSSGERRQLDLDMLPSSNIVGLALDARGAPRPGARIVLKPLELAGVATPIPGGGSAATKTDAEGRFEFRGIEPGAWQVSMPETDGNMVFSFFGSSSAVHQDVQLPAGETIEIVLSAEPKARISGRVLAAGKPVEGARVEIGESDGFFGPTGPSATTDRDGRYRIEGVDAGEQTLTVKAKGAPLPTRGTLEVTAAIDNPCDIDLPGGAIAGRIVSADSGAGIAGLEVEAREIDADGATKSRTAMAVSFSADGGGEIQVIEGGSGRVKTDDQGRFHMPYLPDGDYVVTVKGSGYIQLSRKPIEVREGRITRDVDFSLERGHTLDVHIEGKTGSPYMLRLSSIDDGPAVNETKGSRGGRASFPGLRAGLYKVSVQRLAIDGADGGKVEREVRIRDGDEKVEIDLN